MKDDLNNYFSASFPFRPSAHTSDQRSTDYYKRKTCQGDLENLVHENIKKRRINNGKDRDYLRTNVFR